MLTTVVTLAVVWLGITRMTCHSGPTGILFGFQLGSITMDLATDTSAYGSLIFYTSLVVIGCFSAGMWASPFFDRPVTATIAAVAGGGVYLVFLNSLANLHSSGHEGTHGAAYDVLGHIAVIALASVPYLLTSFQTFTRGESLKTVKRFKVGGIVTAGSFALVAIILSIGIR